MARDGTTKLYTGTSSATMATDIHAWMLADLTCGVSLALTTIGAGVNERNYWVLTLVGGSEILIGCANGTSINSSHLFNAREPAEGSSTQPVMVCYAPTGGFTTALADGRDPGAANFREYIRDTLGEVIPTIADTLYWFRQGGPNQQLHIIEDTDGDSIIMVCSQAGGIGGSTYASVHIFGEEVMLPPIGAFGTRSEAGIHIFANNNSTKTLWGIRIRTWNASDNTEVLCNAVPGWPWFDAIVAGLYPTPGGDIPCCRAAHLSTTGQRLYPNPKYLKFTGANHVPFNTSFGTDDDYNYIRIIQRYVTPWDDSMAPPT